MTRQYVYKIDSITKIVDGDSYWAQLDVGFRQTALVNIRLAGYDCPERYRGTEHEKQQSKLAAEQAAFWFADAMQDGPVWVRTEKDPDHFGRWLGHIWAQDETDTLGGFLQVLGLASVWPTRWRDQYERGGTA